MLSKSLFNKYLTIAFIAAFGMARAQTECKEIKATIEVFQAGQKAEKATVAIDFHGQRQSSFDITLLGKGFSKKDIQEQEIKNLESGKYIIVFNPKNEEDGFCLKHIEFTIK